MKWVIVPKGSIEGYTAAWVAKRSLKEGCNLVMIGPGDKLPDLEGNSALCFGVSFSRALTLSLIKKADSILFFDNDLKMKQELAGIKEVKINMRHTPARMAWEHLRSDFRVKIGPQKKNEFRFLTAPWLVDYSENRELWKWPAINKHFVKIAIEAKYTQTLESWDELASRDLGAIEQEGMEVAKQRSLEQQKPAPAVTDPVEGKEPQREGITEPAETREKPEKTEEEKENVEEPKKPGRPGKGDKVNSGKS